MTANPASSLSAARRTIYAAFFLSGCSGLIYQSLWLKQLALIFGVTTWATAIVLAAFMCGITLGSFWGGRLLCRHPEPIRLFIGLQGLVLVGGLLIPHVLAGLEVVYRQFWQQSFQGAILGQLLRGAIAFVILALPTMAMGATLPLLCEYLARQTGDGNLGGLYAVNTLGATVGTLLAGFFLLPLGISTTNYTASLFTAAAGAITLPFIKDQVPPATELSESGASAGIRWLIPTTLFLYGFSGFALEIIWTRIIALVFNNTTYSFTMILAVVLGGIAIGSYGARILLRHLSPFPLFATTTALFVGWVLLLFRLFATCAEYFGALEQSGIFGTSWPGYIMAQLGLLTLLLLPATTLMGMAIPVAERAYTLGRKEHGHGRDVGMLYAANTLGAIAGSLITGFVLIQHFGLAGSTSIIVALLIVATLLILIEAAPHLSRRHLGIQLVVAILIVAGSGALVKDTDITFRHLVTGSGSYKIIFHDEGPDNLVEVYEDLADNRHLISNRGQKEGGDDPVSVYMQRLQGLIPLLWHPAPKKALFLGMGTGISMAAASYIPEIESVECIELSPGVVKAASTYPKENHISRQDPRLKIITDDARNYVAATTKRYDAIISDLFVPFRAGVGMLYTQEHFANVRRALNKDGLFCQWVPLAQIAPEGLQIILNTFIDTFPAEDTSLWLTRHCVAIIYLPGQGGRLTEQGFPLALAALQKRLAAAKPLQAELDRLTLTDPFTIYSTFFTIGSDFPGLLHPTTAVSTDDRGIIEYTTPTFFYLFRNEGLWEKNLRQLLRPELAATRMLNNWRNGLNSTSDPDFVRLVELIAARRDSYAAHIDFRNHGFSAALVTRLLRLALPPFSQLDSRLLLENYYLDEGYRSYRQADFIQAGKYYEQLTRVWPQSAKAWYNLGLAQGQSRQSDSNSLAQMQRLFKLKNPDIFTQERLDYQ